MCKPVNLRSQEYCSSSSFCKFSLLLLNRFTRDWRIWQLFASDSPPREKRYHPQWEYERFHRLFIKPKLKNLQYRMLFAWLLCSSVHDQFINGHYIKTSLYLKKIVNWCIHLWLFDHRTLFFWELATIFMINVFSSPFLQ